ncbi:MAG TPA: PEP-CTERM sorting domain-containing protein [Gemmatimonadaceae bacterium]|nr:PEP-CTERM sorting domain-containing protein [Gemmatimonadaceae bacterium]
MKRWSAKNLIAALLVTVASQAALAQEQVKLTSPTVPGGTPVIWSPYGFGSFYVSPYSGVLLTSGNQPVVLNCVDFFHDVSLGETWWANKTVLSSGNLSNTRFNNLNWYLQAAWLTQQYDANPGANANKTIAIQSAIWNIFAAASPDKTGGSGETSQSYWASMAAANYGSVDASKFYVLTAVNKYAPDSQQEFLVFDPRSTTTTPEPATLTLMGTGLAAFAGMAKRRRKKNAQVIS